MPAKQLCAEPTCSARVLKGRCPAHARKPWARSDGRTFRDRYGADWQRIRAQVLQEEPACAVCGTTENLTVDHHKPKADGGTDARENLTTLCMRHQAAKAGREGAAARWGRRDG
jgi:5-methylcytosine-specific restriction protein A